MNITPQELQDVKDYLRVDTDFDNDVIKNLYIASIEKIEQYTSCVIKSRDITINTDGEYNIYKFPFTIVEKTGDVTVCDNRVTIKDGGSVKINFYVDLLNGVNNILKTAALKYTYYLYENRDMYEAEIPSDIQHLVNQCRRGLI